MKKMFWKCHRKATFSHFFTTLYAFESWNVFLEDPQRKKWGKWRGKFGVFFWKKSLKTIFDRNFATNVVFKPKIKDLSIRSTFARYIEVIALKTILNLFSSLKKGTRTPIPHQNNTFLHKIPLKWSHHSSTL